MAKTVKTVYMEGEVRWNRREANKTQNMSRNCYFLCFNGVEVWSSCRDFAGWKKHTEKFKDVCVWMKWPVIHATDVKVGTISQTSIVKTSNNLQPAFWICPALIWRQSFGRMGEDITSVKIRLSGMWNLEVTYSRQMVLVKPTAWIIRAYLRRRNMLF